MDRPHPTPPAPSNPLRWFPEFLSLGTRRIRPQARLLGLSLLVGVIAGVGAVLFYVASIAVSHYTLGELAGYHPYRPLGERELFTGTEHPLNLWLLLLIPTLGGVVSGVLVYKLAPEAEGTEPTRSSRPTTSSRASSGRGCRWSRSSPAP